MKIIDHLNKNKGKTLFSFEIIPPVKGKSVKDIFDVIDPLMEFNPPFVDVTYHREEYILKTRENGLLEKVSYRKRPGTVGICAAIMNKYHVDAVPHIICGGFSKEETENALIDLDFLGIDNVLVLRGDPRKMDGGKFIPEPNGHNYASELLQQVMEMNAGKYLDEELQHGSKTQFCAGVAGYPEKHNEAPNMHSDLKFLKQKVDLGAEFIVTQMFFDNQRFFDFVKECREFGIEVPIIPGLKPLTTKGHLTLLPKVFNIDIPDDLYEAANKCKTNAEVTQVGIEWGIQQCKELMDFGVPLLHFYTMSRSETIKAIASKIY
jgi:methylenetetrahydrofolate reductase (NADPH)